MRHAVPPCPASPEPDNEWMTPDPKASPQSGANLPRSNPAKQKILEILAEFFCLRTNDAAELLRNRAITESDARSPQNRDNHQRIGREKWNWQNVKSISCLLSIGYCLSLHHRADADLARAFRSQEMHLSPLF